MMKHAVSIICFSFVLGSTNASLKPRIIGGDDAKIENFPYQASIRYRDYHFCGGAIISERHILTSAHCITEYKARGIFDPPYRFITIVTGSSTSKQGEGNAHHVAKVSVHPKWTDTASLMNDIAVIKLIGNIKFNEKQQKIKLASCEFRSGSKATLTGWGYLSDGVEKPSIQLQKVDLILLDKLKCQFQMPIMIYSSQLCAYFKRGHGGCSGDSGGPLVVNDELVGILSWIIGGECASESPEIYTDVFAFKDFIEFEMKQ